MLALHVEFLAGRFTASAYNDRTRGEWPPHPARVLSALVDALYDADALDEAEAEAVDRLARAGAPWVVASSAVQRRTVTHFVPVNDTAICEQATLTSREVALLEAEHALAEMLDATDKEKAKLEKAHAKARSSLQAEAKKRALHPGKFPKKVEAPKSLPWERVKQPRTFPTSLPVDPRVTYVFDTDEVDLPALERLLLRVARVGHSSSPVVAFAEAVDRLPDEGSHRQVWHPNPVHTATDDLNLRVPLHDQRALLDALHEKDGDKPGRTMPYGVVRYGRGSASAVRGHTDRSYGHWVSFAIEATPDGGRSLPPAHAVVAYAEAFRDALAERAGRPTVLTGLEAGAAAQQPHAAFVGLPFVGHRHADGALRGLALVLPNHLGEEALGPVWQAIALWEHDAGSTDGAPLLRLQAGKQAIALRRVIDPDVELQSLRPSHWTSLDGEDASTWATVTPIALGGACPPFRHRKASVRRDARRRAVALIQRAAARSVIAPAGAVLRPADVEVELRFDPIVPASPHASRVPRYQRPGHDRPRRLVHALLHFPFPVRGPLLLGSGRHLGLGLCLPLGGLR